MLNMKILTATFLSIGVLITSILIKHQGQDIKTIPEITSSIPEDLFARIETVEKEEIKKPIKTKKKKQHRPQKITKVFKEKIIIKSESNETPIGETVVYSEINKQQKQKTLDNWKIEKTIASRPQPDTDYIIVRDEEIDAVLKNSIDSHLGGNVLATIDRNVYGFTGNRVLIPAGSIAMGRYEPLQRVGEERLEILWNRIVTPTGINIILSNAYTLDRLGNHGLAGKVDNRNAEKYIIPFATSTAIAIGTFYSKIDNFGKAIVADQVINNTDQIVKTFMKENLDVSPVIYIEAGTLLKIGLEKDIWFREEGKEIIISELN